MKVIKKVLAWVVALNVIAWIIGTVISKRLTSGNEDSDEFSVAAVMGGKEFKSRATALRSATVVAAMGGVDIDLRGAELDPAGATLTLKTTMGGARIVVPDDWVIDLRHAEKGGHLEVSTTPAEELPDDAPRLLVDATTNLGGAQITTSEYTVVATG